MNYETFFIGATGLPAPFPYQSRLAEQAWPDLLHVPTGMGKTAAITLAWLWKRGWRNGSRSETADVRTPRRLVWCLPMRVLAEQTEENVRTWLRTVGVLGDVGDGKVSVHVLMGGVDDTGWAAFPEEDMILIGTQDMLLSRCLMRGYGMSRYQWPVHFALLHNDCLWVFDEVQLMGAGLATAAQLDAFRRTFKLARQSRSLWVSATLRPDWLDTVDFKGHRAGLATRGLEDADFVQAGDRLGAVKTLRSLPISVNLANSGTGGLQDYLRTLSGEVLKIHAADSQTIVILNRVERAQGLFRLLRKQRPDKKDLLIHARFRGTERRAQNHRLRDIEAACDRIVVATQAIEAGVDVSSKVLITELAPWTSMVQRFGRCNRYGEHNATGASAYWVDLGDEETALLPYTSSQVATAREHLGHLTDVGPRNLPATSEGRPPSAILRKKDLLDLFNTDPDLSGFDVDISDYIRDTSSPGVRVFWRDFAGDPNQSPPQGTPTRDELCPVSLGQATDLHKLGAWYWDGLGDKKRNGRWVKLSGPPRPGTTYLLAASSGGYDPNLGFDAKLTKAPVPVILSQQAEPESAFADDWRSRQKHSVRLSDHLSHVASHIRTLCGAVGETTHADVLLRAGQWHDVGKTHPVFDATMHTCASAPAGFLAKSPCNAKHGRRFFRHELASALAWLAQHPADPNCDLVAYLIAAHHGKVRMSLRAMPTEPPAPDGRRFARGIWEGDLLPALEFEDQQSSDVTLHLALTELGEGDQGPSWTERTLRLLENHGPFQLAWLESLVVLSDWRASSEEQTSSAQSGT